jgi:hypothetical protein
MIKITTFKVRQTHQRTLGVWRAGTAIRNSGSRNKYFCNNKNNNYFSRRIKWAGACTTNTRVENT